MDAEQRVLSNPFSMDEHCENCEELTCEREALVHGYGDVGAEFCFVGEAPSEATEKTGVPFTGDARGERMQSILGKTGLSNSLPSSTEPELENAYLTNLTRCRHSERDPTALEIETCEPYLNAEIRMINPEIIVPVGKRALEEITTEYTTTPAEEFDIEHVHGEPIRGRGFELFPMIDPGEQTAEETGAFVEAFLDLQARDYRQTKGRRKR